MGPAPDEPTGRDTPVCDVRAYGSLNDFLPPDDRYRTFSRPVTVGATVRDVVEPAGIPHPEIDLVMVDDRATDLDHRVVAGDRITVYPRFATLAPPDRTRLLPPRRDVERYVLDGHLGELGRRLRLLGLDAWYRDDHRDDGPHDDRDHHDELVERAAGEDRTLLTREVDLLKRPAVVRGYWVRSTATDDQVREVLRRFGDGTG